MPVSPLKVLCPPIFPLIMHGGGADGRETHMSDIIKMDSRNNDNRECKHHLHSETQRQRDVTVALDGACWKNETQKNDMALITHLLLVTRLDDRVRPAASKCPKTH